MNLDTSQLPLYTASIAAKRANVPYHKVIYDMGKGLIKAFQIKPVILISEREIDRYRETLSSIEE